MSDSAMPNLPGFGAIAESMELVRKMWGGTASPGIGFPGMTTPSMSVQEIDKQIADLKAVEAWLTLNMNMLRGTIQALEVQSATISALKSMGEAFKNAGKATAAAAAQPAAGFSFPFAYPAQPQEPQSPVAQSSQQAGATQPVSPDIGASLADPATWWNLLQGQFTQAVTAATAQTGGGSGNAAAGASAKEGVSPSAEAFGPTAGTGATGQETGRQRRAEPEAAAPTAPAAETTPQSISPSKRTGKAGGKPPSP